MKANSKCCVITLLLMLISCGYSNRELWLRNTVPVPKSEIKKKHQILFTGLNDDRNDSLIGFAQSAYGNKIADVVAKNDVIRWVNKEIKIQLMNEGFDFVRTATDTSDVFVLNGNVLKIYTVASFKYIGEIKIAVKLTYHNELLLDKEYIGYTDEQPNHASTTEGFRGALERALFILTKKLAADIISIDKQFKPQDYSNEIAEVIKAGKDSTLNKPAKTIIEVNEPPDTATTLIKARPNKHGDIIIVSGTRTSKFIKITLNSINREMFTAYKMRTDVAPDLNGTIYLMIDIDQQGKAIHIRTLENSLHDAILEETLNSCIADLNFGAQEDIAANTRIIYRHDFSIEKAQKSKKCCYSAGLGFVLLTFAIRTLLLL